MGMTAPEQFTVLDIETTLDHNTIHGVGLCFSSSAETLWVDTKEALDVALAGTTTLVAHNGINFDFPVLKRVWGWEPAEGVQIVDTLVLALSLIHI